MPPGAWSLQKKKKKQKPLWNLYMKSGKLMLINQYIGGLL